MARVHSTPYKKKLFIKIYIYGKVAKFKFRFLCIFRNLSMIAYNNQNSNIKIG